MFFLPSRLFRPSRECRCSDPERRLPHTRGEEISRAKSLGPLIRGEQATAAAPAGLCSHGGLGHGWAGSAEQHLAVYICREPQHKSHHLSPNTCSGLDFELPRHREKCKSKSCGPPSGPGLVPCIHGAWAEPKTGVKSPACPSTCNQTGP